MLPHLLPWIQLLVLLMATITVLVRGVLLILRKVEKDSQEIEQDKPQGNVLLLTFSYCFFHLRGILELFADVAETNFPFPCLGGRYSFQFKFQGTSSNNTCSSSKDRGNSQQSLCMTSSHGLSGVHEIACYFAQTQKCSKRHCQRALVWFPAQSRTVTRWGQPWLHPATSCLANLQG